MCIKLAATPYRYPGARDSDVHDQLGMSPTIFWRHVHALIQRPDVLAAYPLEVKRLQRLRDRRREARSA